MHRLDHNPARLGGPLDSNGDFSVFHKSGGCEVYAAPTSDGGWLAFVRPCYHAVKWCCFLVLSRCPSR